METKKSLDTAAFDTTKDGSKTVGTKEETVLTKGSSLDHEDESLVTKETSLERGISQGLDESEINTTAPAKNSQSQSSLGEGSSNKVRSPTSDNQDEETNNHLTQNQNKGESSSSELLTRESTVTDKAEDSDDGKGDENKSLGEGKESTENELEDPLEETVKSGISGLVSVEKAEEDDSKSGVDTDDDDDDDDSDSGDDSEGIDGEGKLVDDEDDPMQVRPKQQSFFDEEHEEEEVYDEWNFTDYGLRRRELAKLIRNRTNRAWWERAADGNLFLAKRIYNPQTGCVVDWRNEEVHNRTALMQAAFRGQTSTCRWLIKKELARTDFVDEEGKTPLILAACGGHPETCELLMQHEVDPEVRDNSGWTALMWAVALDHSKCMQVLLDYGADYTEIGLPYPGSSKYNANLSLLPLSAGIYKVEARAEGARKKLGEKERLKKELEARRQKWEAEKAEKERKEREEQEKYRMDIWRRVLTRR